MTALWPDAIVEEGNLASTVSALRKALGDDEQRIIATVPTRGYRFVMPVVRRHAPQEGNAAVHPSNLPQDAAIRIARRFAAVALWSAVMVTAGWITSGRSAAHRLRRRCFFVLESSRLKASADLGSMASDGHTETDRPVP